MLTEAAVPTFSTEGACGTFRVRLCDLQPSSEIHAPRPTSGLRVRRLVHLFETEGCLHDRPEHRLTGRVVLDNETPPPDVLRSLGTLTTSKPPVWTWGLVYYLDGHHRLAAAEEFSSKPAKNTYWTVDVYATGELAARFQHGDDVCVALLILVMGDADLC